MGPVEAASRGARSALLAAPAWQIWGALLIVYVVWGSTYLGIRIVVETMPPMFALGIRFGISAVIIGVILVIRKGPGVLRITRRQLLGALLIGSLLLGIGNGGVMLGERDVPSALAALIIGVIPLVVLVMRRLMGEAIVRTQVVGVAAGLLGLAVLVAPLGLSGTVAPLGILLLLGSTIGWAYGSVLSRVVSLPSDLVRDHVLRVHRGLPVRARRGRAHGRVVERATSHLVDGVAGRARVPHRVRVAHRVLGLHVAPPARAGLARHDLRVRQPGGGGRPRLVRAGRDHHAHDAHRRVHVLASVAIIIRLQRPSGAATEPVPEAA